MKIWNVFANLEIISQNQTLTGAAIEGANEVRNACVGYPTPLSEEEHQAIVTELEKSRELSLANGRPDIVENIDINRLYEIAGMFDATLEIKEAVLGE